MPEVARNNKQYAARKHRAFGCIFVFLLVLLPVKALAELRQYEYFSIDIPSGWIEEQETETRIFTEPKRYCAINITVAPHQGASYNELAILLYQSLQGKTPKADDDGFSFMLDTKSEVAGSVRFTFQGEHFVLVVASGKCENFQGIVETLSIKNQGPRPYPILAPEQTLK